MFGAFDEEWREITRSLPHRNSEYWRPQKSAAWIRYDFARSVTGQTGRHGAWGVHTHMSRDGFELAGVENHAIAYGWEQNAPVLREGSGAFWQL